MKKSGQPVTRLVAIASRGGVAVLVVSALAQSGCATRKVWFEAISERIRATVRATIASQLDLAAFFPYVYFRTESEQAAVESGRV